MLAAGGPAACRTYLTLSTRLAAVWGGIGGLVLREVQIEAAGGGLGLPLVLAARLPGAIGVLDGPIHAHEGDLADRHAAVDRDRQGGEVGELEGEIPLESRIDEAGRRMDHQAQAAERALPLQARDQVVRQADPLERLSQNELAGVQHE